MPDRPRTNRGAPVETLFEAPRAGAGAENDVRGGALPADLRRYGPTLAIPLRAERPTVIVNFVESLDGIVTFDPEHGNGAEISGFNEPDRFVMGLLRSLADAIVVGAGTVRAAPNHLWTPAAVHRASEGAAAAWRRALGLAPLPRPIIVTATGDIPLGHPVLAVTDARPLIVTTPSGRSRLAADGVARDLEVVVGGDDGGHVTAAAVVEVARSIGARLLLSEGGPHLNGTFVAEGLVDELFLTLAPQIVGRTGQATERRYGMVAGISLPQGDAPWARLTSVRRSVDHLFLRYTFGPA